MARVYNGPTGTNIETRDAQFWESDKDHFMGGSYTSVWSSRITNEVRVGWIGEQLGTGAQALFTEDVKQVGFDGRVPFSIRDGPVDLSGSLGPRVRGSQHRRRK